MSSNERKFLEAASRFRLMEDEVGKLALPFLSDADKIDELARKSGMRTKYLIELALVANGLKKRHREIEAA